ncbi:MAG: SBBP repeat-containing protein [Flavisolibacter sp.]
MNSFRLLYSVLIFIIFISCTKPYGNPTPIDPGNGNPAGGNPQSSFAFHKLWSKSFGGTQRDGAFINTNIIRTSDGGYVTAGYTLSSDGDITKFHGFRDFWIIKVDSSGNKKWSKAFGGSRDDLPYSIVATNDGGFLVAGVTLSIDGDVSISFGSGDAWIIKLDSNGNLIWQKSYGGNDYEEAGYIVQTKDGNYLIAGTTFTNNSGDIPNNHGDKDVWLFKIDGNGNLLWSKLYGGTAADVSLGITSIGSGGYVINALTTSGDGDVAKNKGIIDAWLLKVDENGNRVWALNVGGSKEDSPESISSDNDGNVYVAGRTNSTDGDMILNQGDYDLFVAKIDLNGNKVWVKTFGGSAADMGYSICFTNDQNILVAGKTSSIDKDITHNNGASDGWLLKLDNNGNKLWQTNFGGTNSDEIDALLPEGNGTYTVAGTSMSKDVDISRNQGEFDLFIMRFKE